MELIAVYGTLRKGAYNYKVLKRLKPKFVGSGKTKEFYLLIVKNSLPFAIPCDLVPLDYVDLCNNLVVEVYQISEKSLEVLDKFEEHPYVYERKKVEIVLDSTGEVVTAWLYEHFRFDNTGFIIQSGDYLEIYRLLI